MTQLNSQRASTLHQFQAKTASLVGFTTYSLFSYIPNLKGGRVVGQI